MIQISDEQTLLKHIFEDIDSTKIPELTIIAGHFPVRIDQNTKKMYEDLEIWGDFSNYTLEIACKVSEYARNKNKTVRIIFICDDILYQDEDKTLLKGDTKTTVHILERRWRKEKHEFYKLHSGNDVKLPDLYNNILQKYGFSLKDVLRQDHGKVGRKDCIYFSEMTLKNSPNVNSDELKRVNTCSRAYISLLGNDILKKSFLISFVPNKCSHYICDAIDFFVDNFEGSHVFMDTFDSPKKDEMFKKGVFYKKGTGFNLAK